MKRAYILLICLALLSCQQKSKTATTTLAKAEPSKQETVIIAPIQPITEVFKTADDFYTSTFTINTKSASEYELDIAMVLKNGGHFVSPNAKRDFSGKFTLVVDENEALSLVSKLIETPLSLEEDDPHPFVNGLVNWVRINTTYTQKLQRITEKDFTVSGYIQFTIEPRCTLEKVPFVIAYQNGKMYMK